MGLKEKFLSNVVLCTWIFTHNLRKKQKENSIENITWSEMGKQNVKAKEVYCYEFDWFIALFVPAAGIGQSNYFVNVLLI